MIDISTLSDITIDASGNTMTVGGGITVGEVMTTLQAAGKETCQYLFISPPFLTKTVTNITT